MKKGLIIAGLAVAVTFMQVQPVQAINKEWSAVAGFVGGLLFANAANCSPRYEQRVTYSQPVQRKVVYQQPVQTTRVVYEEPVQTGYYAWRTKRVWVPGRWVYEQTPCGTQRKVWYQGHYKTTRYKVWVDTSCRSDW